MNLADEETRIVADKIRRAEQLVAQDLARARRFYPRMVRTATAELIGYERDLIGEPLTEAEGKLLLLSSVMSATQSVLHLLYQGRAGLDIVRMRALIESVVVGGAHEFAKQTAIHAAFRQGRWNVVANRLTEWLVERRLNVKTATELAERIRTGTGMREEPA